MVKLGGFRQKLETKSEGLMLPYMKDQIRGLGIFISDIRQCTSRDDEIKRVNKELGKIRNSFRTEKSLDSYKGRKCIQKLLFIHLLGYNANFGYTEALALTRSERVIDKHIGYLYLSIILDSQGSDGVSLEVATTIKRDLKSGSYQNALMSLHLIHIIADMNVLKALGDYVSQEIMKHDELQPVLKLLLTAYLSFIKLDPSFAKNNMEVVSRIINMVPIMPHTLWLSMFHVLYELVQIIPTLIDNVSNTLYTHLSTLVDKNTVINSPGHVYHQLYSPWSSIRIIQLLQLPGEKSESDVFTLSPILSQIMDRESKMPKNFSRSKSQNYHYTNIINALKFEVANLAVVRPLSQNCFDDILTHLKQMLNESDVNYRTLALESLIKLRRNPQFMDKIDQFLPTLTSMIVREENQSLRLQVVNVVCIIVGRPSKEIVENMITFLQQSNFSIRQELTFKISAIASKQISDVKWYFNSMLNVLLYAGDFADEIVWFNLVEVVSTHSEVRVYAVTSLFDILTRTHCTKNMVSLAAYVFGEYGHLATEKLPTYQLELLNGLFPFQCNSTKLVILSALAKMAQKFPNLRQKIIQLFSAESVIQSVDSEIQQRAFEYKQILENYPKIAESVFSSMPPVELIQETEDDDTNSVDTVASGVESSKKTTTVSEIADVFNFDQNSNTDVRTMRSDTVINEKFLLAFKSSREGVLYEDKQVQLTFSFIGQNSTGTIELFASSTLSSVKVKIINLTMSQHEGVSMAPLNSDSVKMFPGGCGVNFQIACNIPFDSPPFVNLTYITSQAPQTQVPLTLCLPINVLNFTTPYTLAAFRLPTIWNGLNAPGQECVDTFNLPLSASDLPTISNKLIFCGGHILAAVDPNPSNVVVASAFYSTSGTVGCIARLETSPKSTTARLTVRTSSANLTPIFLKYLKEGIC